MVSSTVPCLDAGPSFSLKASPTKPTDGHRTLGFYLSFCACLVLKARWDSFLKGRGQCLQEGCWGWRAVSRPPAPTSPTLQAGTRRGLAQSKNVEGKSLLPVQETDGILAQFAQTSSWRAQMLAQPWEPFAGLCTSRWLRAHGAARRAIANTGLLLPARR